MVCYNYYVKLWHFIIPSLIDFYPVCSNKQYVKLCIVSFVRWIFVIQLFIYFTRRPFLFELSVILLIINSYFLLMNLNKQIKYEK